MSGRERSVADLIPMLRATLFELYEEVGRLPRASSASTPRTPASL